MCAEGEGPGGYAEDGFTERARQGYQQGGSMSAGSMDYGDDDGGCAEFGGGAGGRKHKINEWQAAWNVTNAIQVSTEHRRTSQLHYKK